MAVIQCMMTLLVCTTIQRFRQAASSVLGAVAAAAAAADAAAVGSEALACPTATGAAPALSTAAAAADSAEADKAAADKAGNIAAAAAAAAGANADWSAGGDRHVKNMMRLVSGHVELGVSSSSCLRNTCILLQLCMSAQLCYWQVHGLSSHSFLSFHGISGTLCFIVCCTRA
jgi:hypothetical protein